MPALRNPRHERFAHAYIKIGIGSKAYAAAGYPTTSPDTRKANASRLLTYATVKARIEELRRHMTRRTAVTVESLAEELDEARALALKTEQPSAAVQASTVKAKLFGHLVDRKEVGKPGDFIDAQSAGDVIETVRKELGEVAARALELAIGKPDGTPAPEQVAEPDVEPTHGGSGAVN